MRLLLVFLLATPVLADELLLAEVRAWKGEVVVESRSDPGKAGSGAELQLEKASFIALTDPRQTMGARERLRLNLRRMEGSWKLSLDLKEHKAGGDLVTRGEGKGALHFALNGYLDPVSGKVRFKTGAEPSRFVVRTTLSGVDAKGFAAFRTVASRRSFLSALNEWGQLSEDRRTAKGERTYVDRRGKFPRTVKLSWKLERLDPEVKGRVLDQNGEPVVGATVIARTWGGGRMLGRNATTDAEGRFRIPAHFASWGVQVIGREEDGLVTSGVAKADAAVVKFDEVPDVEIRVKRYKLIWLPKHELLATHFQGDVDKFLDYLSRRVDPRRMAGSEIRPATN
ncbi:MAG: carboxypeptidase-like regulatory domain-containing protein [Planctomycetota bacterium]|jgi:hypothetical protein